MMSLVYVHRFNSLYWIVQIFYYIYHHANLIQYLPIKILLSLKPFNKIVSIVVKFYSSYKASQKLQLTT